jgi:hypothetical protein
LKRRRNKEDMKETSKRANEDRKDVRRGKSG